MPCVEECCFSTITGFTGSEEASLPLLGPEMPLVGLVRLNAFIAAKSQNNFASLQTSLTKVLTNKDLVASVDSLKFDYKVKFHVA